MLSKSKDLRNVPELTKSERMPSQKPKLSPRNVRLAILLNVPLLASIGAPAHAAAINCQQRYSDFGSEKLKAVAAKTGAQFEDSTLMKLRHPVLSNRHWASFKEKARDILNRGNGNTRHRVTSVDDTTPLEADLLARYATGKVTPEQAAVYGAADPAALPPDVAKIQNDFRMTVQAVREYPQRVSGFVDETATLMAQKEALQSFIKENKSRIKDMTEFKMELPFWSSGPDGKPVEAKRVVTFTRQLTPQQLLSQVEKQLADRTGLKIRRLNLAEQEALLQAALIERMETFKSALQRAADSPGAQPLSDDLKKLLEEARALYRTDSLGNLLELKPEVLPPGWAKSQLASLQAKAEAQNLVVTTTLKLSGTEERRKLVEYIKTLSPAEQRALGVERLYDTMNTVSGNRYFQLIHSVVQVRGGTGVDSLGQGSGIFSDKIGLIARTRYPTAAAIGATAAAGPVYDVMSDGNSDMAGSLSPYYEFVIHSIRGKERCVELPSPRDFGECFHTYLMNKYPHLYLGATATSATEAKIAAKLQWDQWMKDPKVKEEIQDGLKRYKEFVKKQRLKDFRKEETIVALTAELPGTMEQLDQIIYASETPEGFRTALLGPGGAPSADSYLGLNYGPALQDAKTLEQVKAVLATEAMPNDETNAQAKIDSRTKSLLAIQKTFPSLARELGDIMAKRDDYIVYGYSPFFSPTTVLTPYGAPGTGGIGGIGGTPVGTLPSSGSTGGSHRLSGPSVLLQVSPASSR